MPPTPALRLLALLFCGALSSCHSVLRVELPRTETTLSAREKRHMAGLLEEVVAGWDGMRQGRAAARHGAEERYELALARFLREWDAHQSPRYWQSGSIFASRQQAFQIDFDPQAKSSREMPPTQIDQLLLAKRTKSHGEDTLSERPGVGVPVVGHIFRTDSTRKEQPFLPPNGGNLTLTAVLEVAEDDADPATPRRCRLHLHNALNVQTVKVEKDERLLAANFTAAKDLALSKKSLSLFSWLGLLYPERTLGDSHLYCMDGYDPQRIPVVFVHGLLSDPHIWLNTVNAISSDPELRAKYQPWYFLYPTGIGVPQTSARLRASLQQARDYFEPEHNEPGQVSSSLDAAAGEHRDNCASDGVLSPPLLLDRARLWAPSRPDADGGGDQHVQDHRVQNVPEEVRTDRHQRAQRPVDRAGDQRDGEDRTRGDQPLAGGVAAASEVAAEADEGEERRNIAG
jgi:hypothetical protein